MSDPKQTPDFPTWNEFRRGPLGIVVEYIIEAAYNQIRKRLPSLLARVKQAR